MVQEVHLSRGQMQMFSKALKLRAKEDKRCRRAKNRSPGAHILMSQPLFVVGIQIVLLLQKGSGFLSAQFSLSK